VLSSVKDPLWGGTMSGLSAADDETAVQGYQAVLAAHANAPDTFETTRTQLMYGARLRRSGQRVKAREQLRTAHEAFEEMDLTAWVLHAADELAATGAKLRACRPQATEPLTSQETRVALHAAKGMPYKEIAAALFLSPKTVEHHLSSVYRKRGFRSRANWPDHSVRARTTDRRGQPGTRLLDTRWRKPARRGFSK
jgi:DNA-binding NarL/FixJ family response regulator